MYWCQGLIAQFPQPQHDELLGSILARFIKRQGIRDDKVALDILFKNRKVVPSPLLQGHIGELHANVGHLWEIRPAEIIERHTLLPLFKPFVPAERYSDLQNNLIEKALNTGSLRTGMNASILKWPDEYRICSRCWQLQLLRHGYNYWQRLFQCPGVETCPEHGGVLDNTGQPMSSGRRHQFSGADGVTEPSVKDVKAEGKLRLLSSIVRQLLDHPQPSVTTQQWSTFYQRLARTAECMEGARINHEKIGEKVQGYWKSEWLDKRKRQPKTIYPA